MSPHTSVSKARKYSRNHPPRRRAIQQGLLSRTLYKSVINTLRRRFSRIGGSKGLCKSLWSRANASPGPKSSAVGLRYAGRAVFPGAVMTSFQFVRRASHRISLDAEFDDELPPQQTSPLCSSQLLNVEAFCPASSLTNSFLEPVYAQSLESFYSTRCTSIDATWSFGDADAMSMCAEPSSSPAPESFLWPASAASTRPPSLLELELADAEMQGSPGTRLALLGAGKMQFSEDHERERSCECFQQRAGSPDTRDNVGELLDLSGQVTEFEFDNTLRENEGSADDRRWTVNGEGNGRLGAKVHVEGAVELQTCESSMLVLPNNHHAISWKTSH